MPTHVMARSLMAVLALALCSAVSLGAEEPPVVAAVNPDGLIAVDVSGDYVTIHGVGFEHPITVEFGEGNPSSTVSLLSSGNIMAQIPAAGSGAVDVIVTSGAAGRKAVLEKGFVYLPTPPPAVRWVEPVAGSLFDSGLGVGVYGEGFRVPLAIDFEGHAPSLIGWVSSKEQYTYWSAGSVPSFGTVDVRITNPDGQEGVLEDGFTFLPDPPPVVTSVGVVAQPAGSGQYIEIYGCNFVPGLSVEFGDTTSTSLGWSSPGNVRALLPATLPQGTTDVTVTCPDGQSGTLKNCFTVLPSPAPFIAAIDPVATVDGSHPMVEFYGNNFVPGVGVKFGDTMSPLLGYVSTSKIVAMVPEALPPGTVDVTVINPDGESATLAQSFTVLPSPAPFVTTVDPFAGYAGSWLMVNIYGGNFASGFGVKFGDTASPFLSWVSSGHVLASVPETLPPGTVDVTVTSPNEESATLEQGFTLLPSPPPIVLRVEPVAALPGDQVTVYGENFAVPRTVEFGVGKSAQIISQSSSYLTVVVPEGSGTVDVIVTAAGETAVLAGGFTYGTVVPPPPPTPAPTIAYVVPEEGGAALGVNIHGTGFHHEATVEFGTGNGSDYVSFRSDEHLIAVVPEGFNTVDVIVTNPDEQQAVCPDGFTYEPIPAPIVDSVMPVIGAPVLGVNVNGGNFHHEATVHFGEQNPADFVSYRGPDQLFVVVPDGMGTVDVIVTNPDGGQDVLPNGFEYEPVPSPEVIDVDPPTGSPVLGVHINGTGFRHGAEVEFGDKAAEHVVYLSPQLLYVVVPDGAGTVDITVRNPGTLECVLENGFAYVPAQISSPTVTEVTPGTGKPVLGISITGTDFQYTPTVQFGALNSADYVCYRTDEELFVVVPDPPTPSARAVDIIISNPDGGSVVVEDGFTYDQEK